MTWVKGLSTWANLSNDLTKLICGEKADDSAVTVASGDRWVREFTRTVTDGVLNSTTTVTSATAAFTSQDVGANVIGTGVPLGATIASVTNSTTVVLSAAATATNTGVTLQICFDTIRTKSALDVSTGNCSGRTGYFALFSTAATTNDMATPGSSVCKVTSPFSSDPSTSGFHRWVVFVKMLTANTVSGNYSTATVAWWVYDADSGAAITSNSPVSPNAAGSLTIFSGLVVSLTDPSGFLAVGTQWLRGFTATYMYGVDVWPMLTREGATTATFSVNPPGVAGTDYDLIRLPAPPSGMVGIAAGIRGNLFYGLGIKTATGNSGALYTASHSLALHKGRIFNSATVGILSLDVGESRMDAVNTSALRCLGLRVTTWAKMFQTPASVVGTSQVQYFMSVKADGITLVLNADPGASGKLGTAYFGSFTPTEPTYDVLPTCFNVGVIDFTGDTLADPSLAAQFSYWSLRRLQDGSEGTRDWQTKWMRCEPLNYQRASGASYTDGPTITQTTGVSTTPQLTHLGFYTGSSGTTFTEAYAARMNKPSIDGKWWLFGWQFGEEAWLPNSATQTENKLVRATNSRFYFVPDDGWGSGDELTDTVSGIKYLLVKPDYCGTGSRLRSNTSTYWGGVAVAEL
jgi:hypothetical protein